MTGGGSGGHITPILAVAHEVKALNKETKVIYIGQRGDSLSDIPAQDKNIDEVYAVRAGKFRRYHGESILKQLLDFPTWRKNISDIFNVLAGIWQSFWLLGKLRPDVIFIKGGFVGVPVGFAAALRRIPYITHDSDAMPGLANRLVAPWAKRHTVAMPKDVYSYPPKKTETVGIPLMRYFKRVGADEKAAYRKKLGVNKNAKMLLVTGGGLGAQRINNALLGCVPDLFVRYPNLTVVIIAGRVNEDELRAKYKKLLNPAQQAQVIVHGFVNDMYLYSGAADVVLTRAGATSIAEFATQAKACVVVPSPFLAGGHQLKNARVLADRKSIRVVDEATLLADHLALMPALTELLDDPRKATVLGERLAEFARPDSAKRLAVILLKEAKK
jgi:UDP-N-acetylglucosamine--N-acetylmuramyl-(pentapeptide) pyrophosphoryl-undecaprenol N-acetylglucosamine transferase